jgi:uracil-DNA glycosylase
MEVKIEEYWKQALADQFALPYFQTLSEFVRAEYSSYKVYPPAKLIFSAFDSCPFNNVKVVIIGQDPYHGVGQAHGLCFSVGEEVRMPPSLVNIFKELNADLGIPIPANGSLTRWAEQGVLLINATLTVRAATPGSHQGKGWEEFTDAAISALSKDKQNLVFILWGAYAQRKGEIIDRSRHLVIESAHPSPFAAHRGFFGSKPFSRTNDYLLSLGKQPVNW